MSSGDARPAEDESGLEGLGTPPDLRAPQPEAPAPPTPVPLPEPAPRRRGFLGLMDSIAYGLQLFALSVWGTAEQPRESDPIERLKRKYGRSPRKY